jgi:hypothetical protein
MLQPTSYIALFKGFGYASCSRVCCHLIFDEESVVRVLELKARVRRVLEGILNGDEVSAASRDWHARRERFPANGT